MLQVAITTAVVLVSGCESTPGKASPASPDAASPASAPDAEDAYREGELTEVDGVYDIVPAETSELDVLYDMLSSFDEDSVQIYAGLIRAADAPAPRPVLDKLTDGLDKALDDDDVRKRLSTDGAEPTPSSPEEYAAFIDRDETKWSKVVKDSGAKAE